MQRNNLTLSWLWWFLPLLMVSCIKSFEPSIDASDEAKIVISAVITNGGGLQTVKVSTTSPVRKPEYIPLDECVVKVVNTQGQEFELPAQGEGVYQGMIAPEYLLPGAVFKLKMTAPDGDLIESVWDTLHACPPIDSVYFAIEKIEGLTSHQDRQGIQFYLNFNGAGSGSHYYRWDVIETWEYHAEYPLEWWYDGTVHHVTPPDYSRNVCWRTLKVPNVFSLTTTNLTANGINAFRLHYVDNTTSRLAYGYSLLVRQFAISEATFIYYDQLRVNSEQEGGLYQKQPISVAGNIRNITHPDKDVLGYFEVNGENAKRIFVHDVDGLPLDFYNYCSPSPLRRGLWEISRSEYPAYLMGDAERYYLVVLNKECVDCTVLGGTTVKPDFWPL